MWRHNFKVIIYQEQEKGTTWRQETPTLKVWPSWNSCRTDQSPGGFHVSRLQRDDCHIGALNIAGNDGLQSQVMIKPEGVVRILVIRYKKSKVS